MNTSRLRLLPVFAVALAAWAGCGEPERLPDAPPPDEGTGTSPRVVVPAGIPVAIDGVVLPAEWADAAERPLGESGTVLLAKQVRGTLLLAVRAERPWPAGSSLWFCFTPDREGAGLYAAPALRLDFEPAAHNRPHLIVAGVGPSGRERHVPDAALARGVTRGPKASVEAAVRLAALGVEPGEPRAVRFALLWNRRRPQPAVTWPGGIRTEGPEGGPPPDLASSEGWGRLTGLRDPDGPGALSEAEWDRLEAEDRELWQRGQAAHDFGILLSEGGEVAKADAEQVPALVGGLRWIAEREPLTPEDLLLLARGYRFLNRPAEALAVLDGLDAQPAWHASPRVAYERALTLESDQRFEEAVGVWEALAARGGGAGDRYRRMADRGHVRLALWAEEQAARAADEAREDLPLVLLRTARGNVLLVLHADDVPEAVEHFLGLVEERVEGRGFYDGTRFHRVIGDFLVQGGDPESREDCAAGGGSDGPRIVAPERSARHGFWRGAVGFALGGARMNGCQFFILVSPRPELADRGFTCFGHVIAGMDAVDRLETCDELVTARVVRCPDRETGGEDR